MRIIAALFLFLFYCFPVSALDLPLSALITAKTIKCNLKEGNSIDFDGKKLSFAKSNFSSTPDRAVINFAKIDLQKGTAIMVGNSGTDDLLFKPTERGIHFLEITETGNLITYTIFSKMNENKEYFFVMSKHVEIPIANVVMPSQWTGFCSIIE